MSGVEWSGVEWSGVEWSGVANLILVCYMVNLRISEASELLLNQWKQMMPEWMSQLPAVHTTHFFLHLCSSSTIPDMPGRWELAKC